MQGYYDERLSADRLRRVYDLAPPRIRRYLDSEISFAKSQINANDITLELGCGYGRAIKQIRQDSGFFVGIDTSVSSLLIAARDFDAISNIALAGMDATRLGFPDKTFNCVFCIQNGISAFHVEPRDLLRESLRVVRDGGRLFFSSYTSGFWKDRLEWFRIQAANGLIGEIDWDKTGDGTIVCKDGFTATTFGPDDFKKLVSPFDLSYAIREIDNSSLFCIIKV